jgi:hypothetical protein
MSQVNARFEDVVQHQLGMRGDHSELQQLLQENAPPHQPGWRWSLHEVPVAIQGRISELCRPAAVEMMLRMYCRWRGGDKQFASELRALHNILGITAPHRGYELRQVLGIPDLEWEVILYQDRVNDVWAAYRDAANQHAFDADRRKFVDSDKRRRLEPEEYGADPDTVALLVQQVNRQIIIEMTDNPLASRHQVKRIRNLMTEAGLTCDDFEFTEVHLLEWERLGWVETARTMLRACRSADLRFAYDNVGKLLNALLQGATLAEIGSSAQELRQIRRRIEQYVEDGLANPEGFDRQERREYRQSLERFKETVYPLFDQVFARLTAPVIST